MKMNDWTLACRVQDILPLGSRRLARPRGPDVALFRTSHDQVFALLDRCPHQGGPLSQGLVFGTSVACPLHNWTIGLDDGCAKAPDQGCVPRFSVRVEDGAVYLDTVELASIGIDEELPARGAAGRTIPIAAA